MRNHKKLEVFALAEELTFSVYRVTQAFPSDELFGLTSQMRRAAVSIGANIVEGSARRTEADYIRFFNIAYGSSCELEYELCIAIRLGYVPERERASLARISSRTCKALRGLIAALAPHQNRPPT